MVILHLDIIIHPSIQIIHQRNVPVRQHENQPKDPFEQQHNDTPFGILPKNQATKIKNNNSNNIEIRKFLKLQLQISIKISPFNLPSYLHLKQQNLPLVICS